MAQWGMGWSEHLTLPAGPGCSMWTSRVWLAQSVSDMLCPSVQLPFLYPYSPLFFQYPLGLGALPVASSPMQSVDLGFAGMLCMCRASALSLCENTFLHISLLPLGSGWATPLGTRPEHSPNFALCNHQLENAESIKRGPKVLVVSVLMLVCAQHKSIGYSTFSSGNKKVELCLTRSLVMMFAMLSADTW